MLPSAALLLLAASTAAAPAVGSTGTVLAFVTGAPIAFKPGVAQSAGTLLAFVTGPGTATGFHPAKPNILTNGSSSTAVGGDGSSWQARIEARTTGPAMTNVGIGGQDSLGVRTVFFAQTSTVQAYSQMNQFGGNGMNVPGSVTVAFNYHREMIDAGAALGSTGWLAAPKFNDTQMGWGAAENVYHAKLRRLHRLDDPRRLANWAEILRNLPGLSGTDLTDQAANIFPTSMRYDSSHANQLGKNPFGDEAVRWIEGEFNQGAADPLPYIPAWAYVWNGNASGRQPGGRLGEIPVLGSLTGVTITSSLAAIGVEISGGRAYAINGTGAPLLAGRYSPILTVARSNGTRLYQTGIHVFPSSGTTAPSVREYDGQVWFSDPEPLAGFANGPVLTIAFDAEHGAGTDGTEMYVAFLGAGNVLTMRRVGSSNVYRFILTDDATGSAAFTLNTGAHTVAAGRKRYVFAANAATGQAYVSIDGAVTTLPFGATSNFRLNPASWSHSELLANSAAGGNAWKGRMSRLWIGALYLAPTSADAAFYNGDGSARDLGVTGAVGGVVPLVHLKGSAGDEYSDNANSGSSNALILQPKGTATTITLGSAIGAAGAGGTVLAFVTGAPHAAGGLAAGSGGTLLAFATGGGTVRKGGRAQSAGSVLTFVLTGGTVAKGGRAQSAGSLLTFVTGQPFVTFAPVYAPSALRTTQADGSGSFGLWLIAKPEGSALDYPIRYALDPGETIVASDWTIVPAETGGMAIVPGTKVIIGDTTACILSGGVLGRVYQAENIATTSAGRRHEAVLAFRITPSETG